MEIIGDTGGQYRISVVADGKLTITPSVVEGTITPGERRTVTIRTEMPYERSALQLRIERLTATSIRVLAATATGSTYQLQRSDAFDGWANVGAAKPGTGADLAWEISIEGDSRDFYRALITVP